MRTRRARASCSATATSTMPSSASCRTNWPHPWVVMSAHVGQLADRQPLGRQPLQDPQLRGAQLGRLVGEPGAQPREDHPHQHREVRLDGRQPALDVSHESNLPFHVMKATFTPGGSRGDARPDGARRRRRPRRRARRHRRRLWQVPARRAAGLRGRGRRLPRARRSSPAPAPGSAATPTPATARAAFALVRQAGAQLAPLPRVRPRAAGDRRVGGHVACRGVPSRCSMRSDLADRLPEGLTMPRAVRVDERPDETAVIWMEAVEASPEPWDRGTYVEAAGLLGRMSGSGRVAGLAAIDPLPWHIQYFVQGRLGHTVLPGLFDDATWEHELVAPLLRRPARPADGRGQPPRRPRRGVRARCPTAPRTATRAPTTCCATRPGRASRSSTSASGARSRSASTCPSSSWATSRSGGATPPTCPSWPRPAWRRTPTGWPPRAPRCPTRSCGGPRRQPDAVQRPAEPAAGAAGRGPRRRAARLVAPALPDRALRARRRSDAHRAGGTLDAARTARSPIVAAWTGGGTTRRGRCAAGGGGVSRSRCGEPRRGRPGSTTGSGVGGDLPSRGDRGRGGRPCARFFAVKGRGEGPDQRPDRRAGGLPDLARRASDHGVDASRSDRPSGLTDSEVRVELSHTRAWRGRGPHRLRVRAHRRQLHVRSTARCSSTVDSPARATGRAPRPWRGATVSG